MIQAVDLERALGASVESAAALIFQNPTMLEQEWFKRMVAAHPLALAASERAGAMISAIKPPDIYGMAAAQLESYSSNPDLKPETMIAILLRFAGDGQIRRNCVTSLDKLGDRIPNSSEADRALNGALVNEPDDKWRRRINAIQRRMTRIYR